VAADFSLALAVGWSWLRVRDQSWQKLEEQWLGSAARFFILRLVQGGMVILVRIMGLVKEGQLSRAYTG
jgi:hypothetical protein